MLAQNYRDKIIIFIVQSDFICKRMELRSYQMCVLMMREHTSFVMTA